MAEAYPLQASFERAVVRFMCSSVSFYGSFVSALDDDCFPSKEVRHIAKACRMFHDETGRGPGAVFIVAQCLRRMNDNGGLSTDDMIEAIDYADEAVDRDTSDEEAVRHELSRVVIRRVQGRTLEAGFIKFAQRGDMGEIARALTAAESVGRVDTTVGEDETTLAADLAREAGVARIPFGVAAVDAAFGGGHARGEFVFALAPPKTGKTLWLVERTVIARREGLNSLAITLELGTAKWRARHVAGLTETPTREISDHPTTTAAWERLDELRDVMTSKGKALGKFACKKMPGGETGIDEIFDLIKRQEDRWGAPVHHVVVDYLDKMHGRDRRMQFHDQMREVYESARLDAEENDRWWVSASQAKGHVKEGDMPTLGDCADSQGKVRVTDGMLGLQKHATGDLIGMVALQVIAIRNGEQTGKEGPFPSGARFGVFLESAAKVNKDVEDALVAMDDEALGVFR